MKSYVIGFALAMAVAGLFYLFVLKQNPQEEEANNMVQSQSFDSAQGEEITLESGLKIQDIKVGTGTEAKAGNTVVVHYTGNLTNGQKFDSSLDRGQPFSFTLGENRVIQGWEQGILGMKVGGKRKLTIPSSLGYGEQGAGNVIPPNAILLFDVELLEVQ